MECVRPSDATNYEWKAEVPSWKASAGRQLGAGDECGARGSLGTALYNHCSLATAHNQQHIPLTEDIQVQDPFINEMDEILYWVHTKRAPCLMNYDNLIKKQHDAAQNAKLLNDKNAVEAAPLPKKKKRKLSLLDDDCASVEKQQNLYFETSQQKQRNVPSSCKSDTLESDIDFNIKDSSVQGKTKRLKKQKGGRTLHKKNKVVTSTPLRRSQRRIQNGACNNEHLNISFDTYNNCSNLNGTVDQSHCKVEVKVRQRSKKSLNKTIGDTSLEKKKNPVLPNKSKNGTAPKEQFEDLSDVSGFTANYIRSTKLHSNAKPHRSLRSKASRNLVKESQQNGQEETVVPNRTTMLVCVNKSVNATTNAPNSSMLNCSTDSSQNVINLVTTKNHDSKNDKVNKSTSLLKFVDAKTLKPKVSHSGEKGDSKQMSTADVNISHQSRSTTNSRYPKRYKKNIEDDLTSKSLTRASLDKRKKTNKDVVGFTDSERKENPEDSTVSRTRSGRSLTLALRQPENSLLVYNNSTEKVSTVNTLNVASQAACVPKGKSRLKRSSSHKHTPNMKKTVDTSEVVLRDSVRASSGFAACFSDSDDDSDALKQRKFFC